MALLVKEIMVENPVVLRPEQSVYSAREIMLLHGYECLFVVDKENRPIGYVQTLMLSSESKKKTIGKIMATEFVVVHQNQTVRECAHLFTDRAKTHGMLVLPVINDDEELVGIVRIRDIVKDLTQPSSKEGILAPEACVIFLAMSKTPEKEQFWLERSKEFGYKPAITQVGTNAEKLPIKLRESTIVAAIAYGVIREDSREKRAVSNAIRDIVLQLRVISPGLGGGFKVGIVRGEGRVAVAAYGRCGHALANSPEQIFMGTSII